MHDLIPSLPPPPPPPPPLSLSFFLFLHLSIILFFFSLSLFLRYFVVYKWMHWTSSIAYTHLAITITTTLSMWMETPRSEFLSCLGILQNKNSIQFNGGFRTKKECMRSVQSRSENLQRSATAGIRKLNANKGSDSPGKRKLSLYELFCIDSSRSWGSSELLSVVQAVTVCGSVCLRVKCSLTRSTCLSYTPAVQPKFGSFNRKETW